MKNTALAVPTAPSVGIAASLVQVHNDTPRLSRRIPSKRPDVIEAAIDATTRPAESSTDSTTTLTLKDWHPDEQPRERLIKYGAQALATSELVAILLRTGTAAGSACDVARDLLHGAGGQLRTLGSLDWRDLARVHGIGKVKAVTLVAALELGRRRATESDVDRPLILTSSAAFDVLGPQLRDLTHEECWVLLLNNARRLIGCERLSSGGIEATVVDVRTVMALALRHRATAFVIAHNHPSGRLTPSEADISLTRQLVEAGRLMCIPLQDHLIVAGRRYYSFCDSKRL